MDRKEACLTFGLIIQPNYIADVFELRQLVDLNAARSNTGITVFHFHKKVSALLLFQACVYLLSPQEAALFTAGEMATLLRLSLWL